METCIIKTPLGYSKISGDDDGITEVTLLNLDLSEDKKLEKETDVIPTVLEDTVIQLQEYFEGVRHTFDLKLNPQGTDFQKSVWLELAQIPFGKTCSYLELSKRLGDPKAIRAVANANAKNPISIITPCHRVIGIDGSLTGYAGGFHRKKWLLEHENPYKQQSLF